MTIHGEGKKYTIDKEKIKDVPLDYSATGDNVDWKSIDVPDWQAMTKEVRDAAFMVRLFIYYLIFTFLLKILININPSKSIV